MASSAAGARSKSPILIAGCQRSGTTLLRTILAGHPDLLVHPYEPQFFLELLSRYGPQQRDMAPAIAAMSGHRYKAPEVSQAALEGEQPPRDLYALTRRYMAAWAGSNNSRPVLKHPAFVYHLEALEALFPGFTALHIVRDPRATVSSQRQRWPQLSLFTCAMWWREALRSARQWAQQRPDRFVEVQYEALVMRPEETVRQLCRQLSLPFYDELLSFQQSETTYEPGAEAKAREFTAPDVSRLDLWRKGLTSQEVQIVEALCAEEMALWGYLPAGGGLTPRARARLLVEAAAYFGWRLARRFFAITRIRHTVATKP